ncbi:aldehyde dehydrogenase (NAD+) [Paenibacillus sp. UNCCL117]|uniref:aldehyde dehydrogenase family protein n=1 Tax=unclassified Paenibacillus TaxID=185978 RepID=UPI000880FFEF|nr:MULTISPECIES: aldehyde dehydrogenase family protein [unclassified Paenibacillus]SDE67561.1 aldehyde dehydrogenase (NAD+) [Paenibacillus sp. cl123]SFW70741.1 aldehyde dehydrogenase (NAD+) [Paenibacillus sp. UNCCL117]
MKKIVNYINGEWMASASGKFVAVANPATGETLAEVTQSTAEDVDLAVQAAIAAQKSWRLVPAPERADVLYKAAQLLKERKEELARILTREMGKVIAEARGEVQEAIDMAYYMAGEGRRLFGDTVPSELRNKFAMSIRVPVGVAGLITPWNFPIAIAAWKSLPALVAGNAVVWKPASETPMIAAEFIKVYEEAGLPKGLVNLVHGSGSVVGAAMVEHPGIDLISFTGSNEVGKRINERAGALLKRSSLEMGGKNAVIVMDDADLELAADGILWSAYGTSGQRCTACSRVIAHEAIKEELEGRLLEGIARLKLGSGLDPSVHVGPVINGASLARIDSYVRLGLEEGAKLLCGGRIAREGGLAEGHFYAPTLFTDVLPGMRIANEEIFGPVVSIMAVRSLEEAVEVNNRVEFGLSSSIFTRSINQAYQAMRDLDTGIVYVNAGTSGAEIHLPFGGTKGTGNGHRDSGVASLDVYTEWKSIYVDYSGKLQRAQIDNY